MKPIIIAVMTLALGCVVSPLARADVNSDMARCAAESNGVKRLECFDSIVHRLGLSSPRSATNTVSKWRVDKETSRMDDSTNVMVSLEAESNISGWPSKTYTPSLVLRCKEKKTEVYIVTGMSPQVEYGTNGATVTLRFDKDKATKIQTSKSTDGQALFFGQSVSFIKNMIGHSTLLFEFVPFNSSPAMTTFDLKGIEEAIKPLRETCKW
ncbi:MAG: type VI secretion protein [Burkholderiaceae bacterium]|jgi:type VI secretion system protein VasI|nr:type VI secretion protein [Burkholderiaceae bacterium]